MKVVGGPRLISNPKPLLYLCCMGTFYLTSEKTATNIGRAKYFRDGSRRMYRVMPTWFRDEESARKAATEAGFRVKARPALGTANAKPKSIKRHAGGKP